MANQALCGGGRYDGLFNEILKEQVPAVGFGMGVERIINILEKDSTFISNLNKNKIYIEIFPIEETDYLEALKIKNLFESINNINLIISIVYNKKLKIRLQNANKNLVDYVIILGENERIQKEVLIKSMKTNESFNIKFENIINFFKDINSHKI